MVNLPRVSIPPLGLPGLPMFSSVRGRVILGFGLQVLILIAVVVGSAWLEREHHFDLARAELQGTTALLLEEASSTSRWRI